MAENDLSLQRAVLQAARQAGLVATVEAGEDSDEEGLVAYLKSQALAVPGSFLTLLGKVAGQIEEEKERPIVRIELVAPSMKEHENG